MSDKSNPMRVIISIVISVIALLFFFVSYIGFINQNINLNKYSKVSGVISEKGMELNNHRPDNFFLSLKDSNKILTVYRFSKKYDDLMDKINVDDTIVVYTKESIINNSQRINIDLIQIENQSEVLLSKNEYEKKYRIVMYVTLLGGIILLILSYLFYRRKIYAQ